MSFLRTNLTLEEKETILREKLKDSDSQEVRKKLNELYFHDHEANEKFVHEEYWKRLSLLEKSLS